MFARCYFQAPVLLYLFVDCGFYVLVRATHELLYSWLFKLSKVMGSLFVLLLHAAHMQINIGLMVLFDCLLFFDICPRLCLRLPAALFRRVSYSHPVCPTGSEVA